MMPFPSFSSEESDDLLKILQGAFNIHDTGELSGWLDGRLQHYLPHDILIATWGDFGMGDIQVEVISSMPGVKSEMFINFSRQNFLIHMFKRWSEDGHTPIQLVSSAGFTLDGQILEKPFHDALMTMRSAVVHGIKDGRGRHDSLYILFSRQTAIPETGTSVLRLLMPMLDMALRQVIPGTHPVLQIAGEPTNHKDGLSAMQFGLSKRELEIMEWVRTGKTNQEIGMILDISAFTVKNHMQRIFKKLDVLNRTQAVATMDAEGRKGYA